MSLIWVTVDLSSYFTTIGITSDGSTYGGSDNTGLDGAGPGTGGSAYSGSQMPSTISWQGETFNIGAKNVVDVVAFEGQTIPLANFTSTNLYFLGLSASGSSGSPLVFGLRYTDSAFSDFFQGMSDWASYQGYGGETEVFSMPYRNNSSGGSDSNTFWVYGYNFSLDPTRIPSQLVLPNTLPNETSGPYSYILTINQCFDTGASGCSCGGTGTVNTVYNVVGTGGAECGGETAAIFLITENDVELTTENGVFLITEDDIIGYDNSYVDHNVQGSGGAVASGTGTVNSIDNVIGSGGVFSAGTGSSSSYHGNGQYYTEVGSGGAGGSGDGRVNGILGPFSRLTISCENRTLKFISCNGAYIPTITRCNQSIIDLLVKKMCSNATIK